MSHESEKINMGFWEKLPTHAVIMAPMADVTDSAFRELIAKYSRHGEEGGGPDVFYTEFVAADGLNHPVAREKLMHHFIYSEKERPIVAQIFSNKPENMEAAARLCRELGFDGIDLNMGCPEKNVCKQGAGCGMIKTPELAKEVIAAAKRGAGDLPVSVKTRVGWSSNEIQTWIPTILECNVAAIILHGRTRKDMSKVPANWDWIKEASDLVKASGKATKFFGNGDILSVEQGQIYSKNYQTDGAMIGRAIFGNPWLFDSQKTEVSVQEKLEVMLEHTQLFIEQLGQHKNFAVMKKHYKAYVAGFDGAKELRIQLMEAQDFDEIERQTRDFMHAHSDLMQQTLPC